VEELEQRLGTPPHAREQFAEEEAERTAYRNEVQLAEYVSMGEGI
jgi:hypothetical protein